MQATDLCLMLSSVSFEFWLSPMGQVSCWFGDVSPELGLCELHCTVWVVHRSFVRSFVMRYALDCV